MLALGEVCGQIRASRVEVADFGAGSDIGRELEVESSADIEDARVGCVVGDDVGFAEVGEASTDDEIGRNGKDGSEFQLQSGGNKEHRIFWIRERGTGDICGGIEGGEDWNFGVKRNQGNVGYALRKTAADHKSIVRVIGTIHRKVTAGSDCQFSFLGEGGNGENKKCDEAVNQSNLNSGSHRSIRCDSDNYVWHESASSFILTILLSGRRALMKAVWWLRRKRTQILLLMAVVGPGIITANVDNDAGGILTYSQAGAQFGYRLLWTMLPITLALIIVQEMCSRMGAVTGKGLSDLIREEFGLRTTFFLMLALVLTNFGNVVSEFAGVASSLELFGFPKFITVPVAAVVVWWIVVKGSYKSVEKVFLAASFFYMAYIIAGVLAKPEWMTALVGTVKPPGLSEFRDQAYLYMTVGIVGTTIAPWMQFYLQASVVEKGVTAKQYKASRLDVVAGCFFTDIVAWFIIVACAATLFVAGHRNIRDAADAAYALRPLAGDYAYILFALGLFNASLFAASILPLSTAYTVCEGLGFESGVDKKFAEARFFYWLYTILIVAGAGLILLPHFPYIKVIIFSQVLNGVVLPFVLIFMLLLINKKELMGEFTNSRFYNVVAWVTVVMVIALSGALMYTSW